MTVNSEDVVSHECTTEHKKLSNTISLCKLISGVLNQWRFKSTQT
jgi:hypothetical protein